MNDRGLISSSPLRLREEMDFASLRPGNREAQLFLFREVLL